MQIISQTGSTICLDTLAYGGGVWGVLPELSMVL